MIKKLKYWLLCRLLKDQELLSLLYVKQIVDHPIEYEHKGLYQIKVVCNE